MAEEVVAKSCLLLVCGLPGSGKSSFCQELVTKGPSDGGRWIHFCYDEVERALRADRSTFDPQTWQEARARITSDVSTLLEEGDRQVIVLDDNMYYRSMRKQWYHLCRDRRCAYHQIFLQAPTAVCSERNRRREAADRVPDFSIEHMAEVFEWPPVGGNTWEDGVSITIDAEIPTVDQVKSYLTDKVDDYFWKPVPQEAATVEEVQSDSHHCDVALRKIVTRALSGVPKELGPLKSTLAKQWGARKAELSKEVAKRTGSPAKGGPASASDLIHEAEASFLQCCVADLQEALRKTA